MVSNLCKVVAIVAKHRAAIRTVNYSPGLFSPQPAQMSKMKKKDKEN
jgi:hypothetical protein